VRVCGPNNATDLWHVKKVDIDFGSQPISIGRLRNLDGRMTLIMGGRIDILRAADLKQTFEDALE